MFLFPLCPCVCSSLPKQSQVGAGGTEGQAGCSVPHPQILITTSLCWACPRLFCVYTNPAEPGGSEGL